ncbi:PREDICTED: cytochrome b-c1 complex subunit 7-like isoform X2 [Dinoponera quadriceps]|uniref:Cytochrome b-c1 complex subunit 7 n=1 Tax=Dinoponera quadriceps TaxID=609295 RepID=A0A6P3X520_DINQU|nr:PREDICTED: cytochrome b-c1 complex subunit 7-like isoform X2 [Dinoponera quadriceps]
MSRRMNQLISLMRDDVLYENEDVLEALRRLPKHLLDERNFRIVRAMQIDSQKRILPEEQWTRYEDDVMYLQPYIKEVQKEREEREKWEAS